MLSALLNPASLTLASCLAHTKQLVKLQSLMN